MTVEAVPGGRVHIRSNFTNYYSTMIKNETLITCRKGVYESPSAEVICLEQMMTVLASNGETQDYVSSSIWELGDENE
jgi:hypothetical protein